MRCPYCKLDNDRVVDSRSSGDSSTIRRRRECLDCGKRFTTYERIEEAPLRVVKKDQSRTAYDVEKIFAGIHRACEKRDVPEETIQSIVQQVEDAIAANFDREVPTSFIGEEVMRHLKSVDQVAYVRFASVYREFKDAGDFARELEQMSRNQQPVRPSIPEVQGTSTN